MGLAGSSRHFGACGLLLCAVLSGRLVWGGESDVYVPPPVPLNNDAASDSADDTNARLFSDGAGRLLAVWESKGVAGGPFGADVDLLYAWSDDQGVTWSDPTPLNADAATDTTDEALDEVKQLDGGDWYAVWHTVPVDDTACLRRLIARSFDNGQSWSAPAVVTAPGCGRKSSLTTNGTGTWLAVWGEVRWDLTASADTDIFGSRSSDEGATWTDPVAVNNDAATDETRWGYDTWDDSTRLYYLDGAWLTLWRRHYMDGPNW